MSKIPTVHFAGFQSDILFDKKYLTYFPLSAGQFEYVYMNTYLPEDQYKTCKRIHESGDIHFITFSCFKRRSLLGNDRALCILGVSLTDACKTANVALWSYVFMPEHVHLLIHPRSTLFDTGHFLANFKRTATCKLLRMRLVESLPVWQEGGGYDRNIYSRDELAQKLAYIHINPVRRGLCDQPESYLWSSAGDQSENIDELIDLTKSLRIKSYRFYE